MPYFLQIDSRLLRAVAIEHPKDADIAVEVVIEEVIPNLSQHSQSQSSTSSYSNKIDNSPSHSKGNTSSSNIHLSRVLLFIRMCFEQYVLI